MEEPLKPQVKAAQPVELIGTETLFVISVLRAMRQDAELRKNIADRIHSTEDGLNADMDSLLDKLEVMSFPVV
jgi:hypothetical protein